MTPDGYELGTPPVRGLPQPGVVVHIGDRARYDLREPLQISCSAAHYRLFDAQTMQVRAVGRASRRSGAIGWPHSSQKP